MAVRYETDVTVSPTLAKKLLAMNSDVNRLKKEKNIITMARDMRRGKWDSDTGETIKFLIDDDGKQVLIDGQNRLHAVIEAGVPIRFDLAFTGSSNAMRVIDSGASRSVADKLIIAHATPGSRMLASSLVRWAWAWREGQYLGASSGGKTPTHSEIIDMYLAAPQWWDAAAARGRDFQRAGVGQGRPMGFGFALLSEIDKELASGFADSVLTGANLTEHAPALTVRNKLTRFRADKMTPAEQLATLIKGWNYMRDGKPMQRIQLTRGVERGNPQLTNANFPMPKGLKRKGTLPKGTQGTSDLSAEAEKWAAAREVVEVASIEA